MSDDELRAWYGSGKDPAPEVEQPDPDRGYAGRRDPLATYFGVRDLKELKRAGFMESVIRKMPWYLEDFSKRVPPEMVAQVSEGVVEVPCTCKDKPTTIVQHNVVTPCEGNCGRWFWQILGDVRVGYDPERHAPPDV